MKREIKFRAWDQNHRKMLPNPEVAFDWESSSVNDLLAGYGGDLHAKYIYMQYTGLKDKNGVEIYEGDVTTQGIVVFRSDLNYDSGGAKHPGFYFESLAQDYSGELQWPIALDDCEVKGNICENPELLERTS